MLSISNLIDARKCFQSAVFMWIACGVRFGHPEGCFLKRKSSSGRDEIKDSDAPACGQSGSPSIESGSHEKETSRRLNPGEFGRSRREAMRRRPGRNNGQHLRPALGHLAQNRSQGMKRCREHGGRLLGARSPAACE